MALETAAQGKVLVFIPMYNCAAQAPRVIAQLNDPRVAAQIGGVLCVDNRSTDGTVDAVLPALEKAPVPFHRLLRNNDNYGLGGSHKVAMQFARENGFDHLLVLHGDDQGAIADIIPFLESGAHREVDCLLGARFMRGSTLPGYSLIRILGNHVFNWIFTIVARQRVYDLGSGLNLFGRRVLEDPDVLRYSDDLRFNVYLLLDMVDKRRKIRYIPISWREEDQRSNVKLASQAFKTLAIAYDYALKRAQFRSTDHRDKPRAQYSSEVLSGAVIKGGAPV